MVEKVDRLVLSGEQLLGDTAVPSSDIESSGTGVAVELFELLLEDSNAGRAARFHVQLSLLVSVETALIPKVAFSDHDHPRSCLFSQDSACNVVLNTRRL